MELIVEGPPVAPEFEAALNTGVETVGVTDLTVIYTNDFVGEVRMLTGDQSYGQDRGSGTVAAKTLEVSTGEVVVVMNRGPVEEHGPDAAERVMAHECGHVLIDRRVENVSWMDTATRLSDSWERTMAYVSANAFDEYRAEATVYNRGYPVEFGRTDEGIADALFEANGDILDALTSDDSKADPGVLQEKVLALMDRVTKTVADLAARHLHAGGFTPAALNPVAQEHWAELIAPTWDRHLAFFTDIPRADQTWGRGEALTASTTTGAVLANELMRSLGFYAAGADGAEFWPDFDDAKFQRRVDRFFADRELRGLPNEAV